MKKTLSVLVCLVLALLMLAGSALADYQVNTTLDQSKEITLNVFGPGVFSVGPEAVTDLVSGLTKPGFNVIINRWNELYPNVKLVIEYCGWDSWQANITTACLEGNVDVIMHGATMVDLTKDLAPYVQGDPEYAAQIYALASRRTTANIQEFKVSGISLSLSPAVAIIDKQIFADYGIDLPTKDWTYDTLLELAAKLTGTDPVTGEQTYGYQMWASGANNLWMNYVQAANSVGAKIFKYGTSVKDTVVDYKSPEAIKAWEILRDLSQFCSPESLEGVGVTEVLNGTNNWAILCKEGPISLHFEAKAAGLSDRYMFLNLPLCTEGEYKGLPTPHAGDNNMAIYKDSDAKEWAWEFIKFMNTDPVATQWVIDGMNWPNNKAGKELAISLIGEELASTMDFCLSSLPLNYNNATNDVFNNVSFGATTNAQITAVSNVINGYMTPEEAAQYMQDYVDSYLASLQ